MKVEKLIAGLILLPFIVLLLLILLPLILFFGILSLVFRRPVGKTFIKTDSFQWNTQQKERQDDDVIDVEVIHSENTGEKNDLSGRTLR